MCYLNFPCYAALTSCWGWGNKIMSTSMQQWKKKMNVLNLVKLSTDFRIGICVNKWKFIEYSLQKGQIRNVVNNFKLLPSATPTTPPPLLTRHGKTYKDDKFYAKGAKPQIQVEFCMLFLINNCFYGIPNGYSRNMNSKSWIIYEI
jgi:hypothetical protein